MLMRDVLRSLILEKARAPHSCSRRPMSCQWKISGFKWMKRVRFHARTETKPIDWEGRMLRGYWCAPIPTKPSTWLRPQASRCHPFTLHSHPEKRGRRRQSHKIAPLAENDDLLSVFGLPMNRGKKRPFVITVTRNGMINGTATTSAWSLCQQLYPGKK